MNRGLHYTQMASKMCSFKEWFLSRKGVFFDKLRYVHLYNIIQFNKTNNFHFFNTYLPCYKQI
jgi:hypothetical protein